MSKKILVAIPYHRAKRYAMTQLLNIVDELTYDNKEVVMRWDPGEYGATDCVKKQREYFRQLAITGEFDYLYFLGADTIPPKNVLETLLAKDKDVIGGVYWGRHGADNSTVEGAVAWIHGMTQEKQFEKFSQSDKLLKIDGMGMDCVLFSRKAFMSHSFLEWDQNDDDYPYYDLLKADGFEVFLDTSVQCMHFATEDDFSYIAKRYALSELA